MYNVRQFKSALYLLLMMGIVGFALATGSPGTFVLGGGAVMINAWLVKTGRFRPISRLLSNLITLAGLPWVFLQTRFAGVGDEVMWIGQYLVLLQVVKLFEQRGNRDYAQLLVLGLLLMVAAAIDTASLAFGLLLIIYLFLSLYCCLLFHLKVEADLARAALDIPDDKLDSATLRQDQRYMARSMRQMTVLVAAVALIVAVAVFLFFPRSSGEGLFGSRQYHPEQALTGFNSEVNFQQVAKIAQSSEVIAYVQVWKNDKPVRGNETLLLRGLTLEHYHTAESPPGSRWAWTHQQSDDTPFLAGRDAPTKLPSSAVAGGPIWRQRITLRPTGTNALFAMAGPLSITMRQSQRVYFLPATGVLRTLAPLLEQTDYEVCSTNSLDPPAGARTPTSDDEDSAGSDPIDPRVLALASRPEVSGSNSAGPLAAQRARLGPRADVLDEQIASNIEKYLRTHFTYTLDLTDANRIEGRDPIVEFLYRLKRGHCEYFAGAMTLMCQSLGMDARMVVGFKCNEFSTMGSHYIVRQSDAHSWVEVRTAGGWKSFDPTSGTEADLATRARGGLLQDAAHLVDYLEYTYADNIIAYDNGDRKNLIQTAETTMFSAASNSRGAFGGLGRWARDYTSVWLWKASSTLIGAIVWLMVFAILAAFIGFIRERWRLRRRATRMGIDALPAAEQQRLARQLAFYDHLTLMLGRHQLVRPKHLTPMEFCESLLFLPSDIYDTIRRLTALFYRVRFGRAQLSPAQQRRLETVLARLNEGLIKSTAVPPR